MNRIDIPVGPRNEKPFSIVYDALSDVVEIDGVKCSADALRMIFVEPREDVTIRFERKGDVVLCHSEPIEGVR